jgi:hypothetical protein
MLEAGFALLRLPAGRSLARRIFFGRGSFPDVATAGERAKSPRESFKVARGVTR